LDLYTMRSVLSVSGELATTSSGGGGGLEFVAPECRCPKGNSS